MKRTIYFILLIIPFLWQCSDYLDKQPDDMKTDEMVWRSRAETEAYLYNIYSTITPYSLHQQDPWLGCSDEIDLSWAVYPTYKINLGNWNPSVNYFNLWGHHYKGIRSSFVFEKNVDRCKEISAELKTQYKAEVKFLRGYIYWLLIRQYGPVPLIKELLPLESDWNIPRAPYDECVDYICQMMDEAEKDLPLHWHDNDIWYGKPNKIVCKAVKSQVLTMAASPQWNGNKEYAEFKNLDGTPLVNTTYDENKWKKAAQASLDVIKISENNPEARLGLYKNAEGADFSPYKSVRDVILKNWNCEIIFGRICDQGGWEIHASPGPYNLGGVGPTQRVVDAFYMENGRTIDDPLSNYSEEGFASEGGQHWNPKNYNVTTDRVKMIRDIRNGDAWGHWPGDWNMYANREPRFYASILYNKRIIPQLTEDATKRDGFSSTKNKNGYGRVELYYGGLSRSGTSGSYTFYPQTGYLALKNCNPMSDMSQGARIIPLRMDIYIRYATILLNYIEALNEYDPTNPHIKKYWDMIRERAGLPSIFDTYPEIKGNKEKQLEYILRERQVELCFETDRYFTSRRRWLAGTPDTGDANDARRKWGDGGRMWGMDINAGDAKTNDFSFTGFYKRVPFETRVFNKAYYLFPIPQSEIERNLQLVQNPWWE